MTKMDEMMIQVLYGSETGTAQDVAEQIWKSAKRFCIVPLSRELLSPFGTQMRYSVFLNDLQTDVIHTCICITLVTSFYIIFYNHNFYSS